MQTLFFSLSFFKRQFLGTFFFFRLSQRQKGERAKEKTDSKEKETARSGRERSWRGAVCGEHPGQSLPCWPWAPSNVHVPHVSGRAGQVQLFLLFFLLGSLGVQVLLLGLAQARLQQGFDLLLAGPEAVLVRQGVGGSEGGWSEGRIPPDIQGSSSKAAPDPRIDLHGPHRSPSCLWPK